MENWRLSDPEYTDFEPTTVQEAILRFRRMQSKGLNVAVPGVFHQVRGEAAARGGGEV